MNNIDKQYQQLLKDIIEYGIEKQDRTGTGTKSIFGYTIRHNMKDGFPLLTTKKLHWPSIVSELLWFLQGRTDLRWLLEQGNTIWVGDAYKNYKNKIENYSNNLKVPNDISEFQGAMDIVSNQIKSHILSQEEFINKIRTDDEFAKKWGDLGSIYGKQWRKWGRKGKYMVNEDLNFSNGTFTEIDQISNLINDLKTNPDSRRLMVNAWNVGELDQMVLPPCHYGFQVYTRELSLEERYVLYFEKLDSTMVPLELQVPNIQEYFDNLNVPRRAISLMWNQRSVDTFLGLPFNIASYGLLLEIIAKEANMVPDELIGNLGDVHLYNNHIEQAKEQLTREPMKLPIVKLSSGHNLRAALKGNFEEMDVNDVMLIGYDSHPAIKAPLSN